LVFEFFKGLWKVAVLDDGPSEVTPFTSHLKTDATSKRPKPWMSAKDPEKRTMEHIQMLERMLYLQESPLQMVVSRWYRAKAQDSSWLLNANSLSIFQLSSSASTKIDSSLACGFKTPARSRLVKIQDAFKGFWPLSWPEECQELDSRGNPISCQWSDVASRTKW
jgi:hypothetical protein